MARKIKLKKGERLKVSKKKFFEMFGAHSTKRCCARCLEEPRFTRKSAMAEAVAWLFRADKNGAKDRSSRVAVCREHLAAEQGNL